MKANPCRYHTRELARTYSGTSLRVVQSTLISADPEFTIQTDNYERQVLKSNQQCLVVLSFLSQEEGKKAAAVSFSITSTQTPTVTVAISAEVVPAPIPIPKPEPTQEPWPVPDRYIPAFEFDD